MKIKEEIMAKKIKIQIKSRWLVDKVLFEYESEDNTILKTVNEANLYGADLREADLSGANLREADLREADLSEADLSGANLSGAYLRGADLREAYLRGADLREADLREVPFTNLPKNWIDDCSKDILYVMNYLKNEVPHLKKKLLAGEVDGSQYDGDCACLVGSLANAEDKNESETEVRQFCSVIPFYELGTHNPGEQFYLNIKKGDTPKTNELSKHAVKLCNMILGLPEDDGIEENAKEEISTIEIDGKKYRKNDVEERLKELPTLED